MTTATKPVTAVTAANLTEKQAAEYLGVSVHSLRRWRMHGGGSRFLKMGSRVAYPITELEAFQAACLRRSTSDQGTAAQLAQTGRQAARVRSIGIVGGKCSDGLLSSGDGDRGEAGHE